MVSSTFLIYRVFSGTYTRQTRVTYSFSVYEEQAFMSRCIVVAMQ